MDILSFILGYNKGKGQGGGGNAPAETDIFPLQTVEGFVQDNVDFGGAYMAVSPVNFTLTEGETYYVEWDGTTYTCEAKSGTFGEQSILYLGNDTLLGGTSDEPFTVGYFVDAGIVGFLTLDSATTHDIRVYQKAESSIEVKPLTITANGTYTAPDGEAYSPVTVAVAAGVVGEILPGYELIEILPRTELTFKFGVSEAYPFNPVAVIADEEGKETMDVLQNGDDGLVFWGKNNAMYAVSTGAKETPPFFIGGATQPLTFQNLSGNTGVVKIWGWVGAGLQLVPISKAGGSFEPFLISTDKDYVIAADGSPNVLSESSVTCTNFPENEPYSQLKNYFVSAAKTGLQKLNVDQTYYVNWDSKTYTCQARSCILTEAETGENINATYIGNGTIFGEVGAEEPFIIICYATDSTEANFKVVALDAADRTPTDSLGMNVRVDWARIWTYEEFTLPVQIYKIKQKKYAVNFYDDDTVTLLNTVQVGHGNSYTYTPTKEGYIFKGWSPEPTNVTAPMDCYAQWEEKPNFAKSSWAKISEISQAGQASEYFALGDTRIETLNYSDGTSEEIELQIVAIGKDTTEDGTPTMTLVPKHLLTKKNDQTWSTDYYYSKTNYNSDNCNAKKFLEGTVLPAMSSDLQSVLQTACPIQWMTYYIPPKAVRGKISLLNYDEIGLTNTGADAASTDGILYGFGNTKASRIRTTADGTAQPWWELGLYGSNVTTTNAYSSYKCRVTTSGSLWYSPGTAEDRQNYYLFKICV